MITESNARDLNAQLSDLATVVAELRSLPPSNDSARKSLEAECSIRIQTIEQLLRDRELDLQERTHSTDTDIRSRELLLKEASSKLEKWRNPLTVGVIVAALSLLGNFVNGLWSNFNQQAQLENQRTTERIKLENDLIKEAIKPTSEQDRAKSLVFFAKNRLISLNPEVVKSLVEAAGTERPVPGSSTGTGTTSSAAPVTYKQSIVDRVLKQPRLGLPDDVSESKKGSAHQVMAVVLHDAIGPDSTEEILKSGRSDLPGPLAHWLVKSDGAIVRIVPESTKANHLGMARDGLINSNTIGVMVSGSPALQDDRQIEALVRLVLDICQRWELPPDKIFSHAEVAVPPGRKADMLQQAPMVREMVRAVNAGK